MAVLLLCAVLLRLEALASHSKVCTTVFTGCMSYHSAALKEASSPSLLASDVANISR
jgi:hypothetical protein